MRSSAERSSLGFNVSQQLGHSGIGDGRELSLQPCETLRMPGKTRSPINSNVFFILTSFYFSNTGSGILPSTKNTTNTEALPTVTFLRKSEKCLEENFRKHLGEENSFPPDKGALIY